MLLLLNRLLKCHGAKNITPRYFSATSTMLCNAKREESEVKGQNTQEFTTIYKFPYIRAIGIVNRLKIFQGAATAVAIPASLMLSNLGIIDSEVVMAFSILGITCCVTFFSFGYLTERFIGFIYVDKSERNVKFSYVDFWGLRKDEIVPIDDVCTFSDLPVSVLDSLFYQLPRKTSKDCFKLNIRIGEIVDSSKFNKLFMPVLSLFY